MANEDTKRFLIERTGGESLVVEIPASWKVTFGKLHPTDGRDSYDGSGKTLRMYESDNKQRAVFTNVIAFRDLSIKVRRKVVNVEEKKFFAKKEGKQVSNEELKTTVLWVDGNEGLE